MSLAWNKLCCDKDAENGSLLGVNSLLELLGVTEALQAMLVYRISCGLVFTAAKFSAEVWDCQR